MLFLNSYCKKSLYIMFSARCIIRENVDISIVKINEKPVTYVYIHKFLLIRI